MRMIRTFGAPFGARSCSIGGNCVSGSFASYVINPVRAALGIGRCDRCFWSSLFMVVAPSRAGESWRVRMISRALHRAPDVPAMNHGIDDGCAPGGDNV